MIIVAGVCVVGIFHVFFHQFLFVSLKYIKWLILNLAFYIDFFFSLLLFDQRICTMFLLLLFLLNSVAAILNASMLYAGHWIHTVIIIVVVDVQWLWVLAQIWARLIAFNRCNCLIFFCIHIYSQQPAASISRNFLPLTKNGTNKKRYIAVFMHSSVHSQSQSCRFVSSTLIRFKVQLIIVSIMMSFIWLDSVGW